MHDSRAQLPLTLIIALVVIMIAVGGGFAVGSVMNASDDGVFVAQDNDVNFADGSLVGASVTYDGTTLTITPNLLTADVPADEECLTYEATGPRIEYQACGATELAGATATADRSLTWDGSGYDADAELFSHACTFSYIGIATDSADSGFSNNPATCAPHSSVALTVSSIYCITSVGAASPSVDEVTRANIYGSGTPLADFVPWNCTTTGRLFSGSITNASIAAGSVLRVGLGTATNDMNLTLIVEFTADD